MISFFKNKNANLIEIRFEGGLGTQILQAATFFDMKSLGEMVDSNFSYFENNEADLESVLEESKLKKVLNKRPWSLDIFNITIKDIQLRCDQPINMKKVQAGNALIFERGLNALKKIEIKKLFIPKAEKVFTNCINIDHAQPFICIHMRRGDYLTVSSHIISDDEFLGIAKTFSNLVKTAVFISDSPIKSTFQKNIQEYFECAHFLDSIDPLHAHILMRKATILICSNSTFSLTAALLGENKIKIIPKTWFGKNNEVKLQNIIASIGDFQILP